MAELPLVLLSEVFAAYGKPVRSWSESRKRALRGRMGEAFEASDLVLAVHGYAWMHRAPGNGFDPLVHFKPETIFRAGNFAKYLEAALEARASGESPPYAIRASPARAVPRFEGVEERNQREIREWVEEQKQKSATS